MVSTIWTHSPHTATGDALASVEEAPVASPLVIAEIDCMVGKDGVQRELAVVDA
jgi:hypothetical protein